MLCGLSHLFFGGDITKYVFLILFFIDSAIHLYASLKKNVKLRAITKPFILLFLALWYVLESPSPKPMVLIALFFSWLGDVLLIPNGIKWFTAGGISFMVSHFAFVLCYFPQVDFSVINPIFIVLVAVVYIASVVYVFKGLRPFLPKALFYPMFLYLLINGTMNSFAWYQFLTNPCLPTIVTLIGALLFFASDSILFYVRFSKTTRWKTHFPVMVTYIFAEFLIVYGIILYERILVLL